MDVRKSALVGFPADAMFDLIEAAEDYPKFLPWCVGARILERNDSMVSAEIAVDYHGVRFSFTTRNPKRRPEWLAVRLVQGPFRRFEGEWHIRGLAPSACKIEFSLGYEFGDGIIGTVASPVFHRIANSLVNAYVARAEEVLGSGGAHDAARELPTRE